MYEKLSEFLIQLQHLVFVQHYTNVMVSQTAWTYEQETEKICQGRVKKSKYCNDF